MRISLTSKVAVGISLRMYDHFISTACRYVCVDHHHVEEANSGKGERRRAKSVFVQGKARASSVYFLALLCLALHEHHRVC